jgi:hypothetical protein
VVEIRAADFASCKDLLTWFGCGSGNSSDFAAAGMNHFRENGFDQDALFFASAVRPQNHPVQLKVHGMVSWV